MRTPEISNVIKAFACNLLYQVLRRFSWKLLDKFNDVHEFSYNKINITELLKMKIFYKLMLLLQCYYIVNQKYLY